MGGFMKNALLKLLLGKALGAIATILFIASGLYSQENPFLFYGPPEYNNIGGVDNTVIRYLRVNSANRFFYLTRETTFPHPEPVFADIIDRLGYIDTDNILYNAVEVPYHNSSDDTFYRFALFGQGVAIPYISMAADFVWKYCDFVNGVVTSEPLVLPYTFMSDLTLSQIDEEHCLLKLRHYDTNLLLNMYYLAYVDANAQPIWSYMIPSTVVTQNRTVPKAVLIDSTHCVLGIVKTSVPHRLSIVTMNSNAGVEDSLMISLSDTYCKIAQTKIPGTVLFAYITTTDGPLQISKYADGVLTNLISINRDYRTDLAMTGDSTGFCLFTGNPGGTGNQSRLMKYDWNGNPIFNLLMDGFTPGAEESFDVSPTGNYYLAGYAEDKYAIAKVMADGEFTEITDDSIPMPDNTLSAYPNPFGDSVKLSFELKTIQPVVVNIYNIKGQFVKRIAVPASKTGLNELLWDGTDSTGNPAPNGMYLLRVQAGGSPIMKKCLKLSK
jgi:hypothetical protein